MAKQKRSYYLIEKAQLEDVARGCGISGVMDMLRFDGAKVECNAPNGFWLLSCEGDPGVARWRSFGIKVVAVSTDPFTISKVAARLQAQKGGEEPNAPGKTSDAAP